MDITAVERAIDEYIREPPHPALKHRTPTDVPREATESTLVRSTMCQRHEGVITNSWH